MCTLQFNNSANITLNGISQVYNGANATGIPFTLGRKENNINDINVINVTVCDLNNASSCQLITTGVFLFN